MSYTDAPAPDELTARIDRLEHEIAKLRSEREIALTGWPSAPTIAQGFMSGRWQRRDGADYPSLSIPEAPSDQNYYGRYQGTWQPVVEEAPGLTARRSTYGWARASAGSDITWLSLDDTLANFVTEVPVGQGMYARSRSGGTTGWTDLAGVFAPAGNYLDKAGGQMTGPLITRDGGSATNPGLAIGENTTGFYKSGASLLVTTVSGQIVQQIQPAIAAYFVPVNFTGHRLNAVGDATVEDDALNVRSADTRYVTLSGGALTGPLITQPGTGARDLAIGIGEDTTGFYRQGNGVVVMVAGYSLAVFEGDGRALLMTGPLGMGANRITAVGDATAATDALNRQSADARYFRPDVGGFITGPMQLMFAPAAANDAVTKGYVDAATARAPTVIFDIPADVTFTDWQALASITYVVTRPGLSRIQVSLACNLTGVSNVACVAARLAPGGIERQMFVFGAPPTSCGFSCTLYFDTSPGTQTIPVQVASLSMGAAPPPLTIVGGPVPQRSQITVTDLGPI